MNRQTETDEQANRWTQQIYKIKTEKETGGETVRLTEAWTNRQNRHRDMASHTELLAYSERERD